MNKKQLSKYFYLSLEINDIENKIYEIRNKSVGISRLTGMPFVPGTGNPVENQVALIEKYTEKLNKKKLLALEEILKIEEYIQNIEDIETRMIFNKRYVELKPWHQIAREMYMSEPTVFRKHKNQLKRDGDNHD